MARNEGTVLGIDILAGEVRVVEMTGRWDAPRVLKVVSGYLPPREHDSSPGVTAAAISSVLRDTLAQHNIRTRTAVIGIQDHLATTIALEVPPVPANELGTVVQTELEHYHIIPPGGAFDYTQLPTPGNEAPRAVQVVAAATDRPNAAMFVDIADRAGLSPLILETRLLSLYRAALPQLQVSASSVCLAMDDSSCSLFFLADGAVRLHRHLDVGHSILLANRDPWPEEDGNPAVMTPSTGPRMMAPDEEDLIADRPADGTFVRVSVDELTVQVERSIDFFHRQFPDAPMPDLLVIASHRPEIAPLADTLGDALGITASMVVPCTENTVMAEGGTFATAAGRALRSIPGGAVPQSDEAAAMAFTAAAGAAMRALTARPSTDLCLSLSPPELGQIQLRSAQIGLATSLVISLTLVVGGIVGSYLIGTRARSIEHFNEDVEIELHAKQAAYRTEAGQVEADIDRMTALKQRGLPVPFIVDLLSGTVAERAGLTEIAIDRAGQVRLVGQAADERAMIDTLNRLKVSPCLTAMSLDSFDQSVNGEQAPRVQFRASATIVGAPKPVEGGAK